MKKRPKTKIIPFLKRGKESTKRPGHLFHIEGKVEVYRLIPKDVRDRFEKLPFINGKRISSFRDFLSYVVTKKLNEDDHLYEFYNKIEISWLSKDEYMLFRSFYSKNMDLDSLWQKLMVYENSAINRLRSAMANRDEKETAKANTRYYFCKLMWFLIEERLKLIN